MTDTNELPSYVLTALRNRGFRTSADLAKMSAADIFDEYCGWELGSDVWGKNLRLVMEAAERHVAKRDGK